MKQSLRTRILISLLLVTALLMVGLGTVNYLWMQRIVISLSEQKAEVMAKAASGDIATYLLQKGQYAWTIAQDEQVRRFVNRVETRYQDVSKDADYQQLLTTFRRIVNQDPDINEAYIAVEKTQRIYDVTEYENPPGYMVRKRPWYQAAIGKKGLAYTNPYRCPVTGKWVVTASVPFYDDKGKLLGVACVDIYADKLRSIVENVHLLNTGYAFLIDNKGQIIIHPNQKFEGKSIRDAKLFGENVAKIASEVTSGNLKSTRQTFNGVDSYWFLSQVDGVGWSLVVVVPVREVTSVLVPLGRASLITTVFGLILVSVLIFVLTLRITKPLEELTGVVKQVSDGDYSIRARIDRSDEVGRLGKLLNELLDKQKKLTERVLNTAYRLGIIGHELAITIGEASASLPIVSTKVVPFFEHGNERSKENKRVWDSTVLLVEKISVLHHRCRNLLSQLQNAREALATLEDVSLDTRNSIDLIVDQVVVICEMTEELQGGLVDLYDGVEELIEQVTELNGALRVLSQQVESVVEVQTRSLDKARGMCMELVKGSQELLTIASSHEAKNGN